MNPAENPEPTPPAEQTPQAPAQPVSPAAPVPRGGKGQEGSPLPAGERGRGEGRGPRPGPRRERRERPREPKAPVRELRLDDFGANAPRLKDLDASITDELDAAMAGFEGKELLGEPQRSKRPAVASTEQGRKKG